jgi:hypothetical protein
MGERFELAIRVLTRAIEAGDFAPSRSRARRAKPSPRPRASATAVKQ